MLVWNKPVESLLSFQIIDFLHPSFLPGENRSEIDLKNAGSFIQHFHDLIKIFPINFSYFLLEWANFSANCRFGIFPV